MSRRTLTVHRLVTLLCCIVIGSCLASSPSSDTGAVGNLSTESSSTIVPPSDATSPIADRSPCEETPEAFPKSTVTVTVKNDQTPSKLANLQQRTVPAVILLTGLYAITKFFQEAGLKALLLAMSIGLYHEAVSVAEPSDKKESFSNRWLWFGAYSTFLTLPQVVPSRWLPQLGDSALQLVSCTLLTLSWVALIVNLNKNTTAVQASTTSPAMQFKKALVELSVYHMAILCTTIPVALWMAALSEFGLSWALYSALLVIINDTAAYLVGYLWHFGDKHALLPVISPKKTWEGWTGALVLTTLSSGLVWKMLFGSDPSMSYNRNSFVLALFSSLVAPFGGFVASTVKRAYDKKDFGSLIGGGHGGLIDRLDCQLFTAPFLYVYLKCVAASPLAKSIPGE